MHREHGAESKGRTDFPCGYSWVYVRRILHDLESHRAHTISRKRADQFTLSESLDTQAIRGLFECGLKTKFPAAYDTWLSAQDSLQAKYRRDKKNHLDDAKSQLAAHQEQLLEVIRESYIESISETYPCVVR